MSGRASSSANHQIAFKFGFVWNYGVGNNRVASAHSGKLTAMTWWVLCGKGSRIGCHADREIALGIVQCIHPVVELMKMCSRRAADGRRCDVA